MWHDYIGSSGHPSIANYHAKGIKGMAHGIVVESGFIYYVKKGIEAFGTL